MGSITGAVSAIAGIGSLISVLTGSATNLAYAKQRLQQPQAQQQMAQQQVQRCPLAPDGRPMQGQFRTLPDGTYQFICVEDVR
jgi:hypothetical protein